jgi:hypothetical protein
MQFHASKTNSEDFRGDLIGRCPHPVGVVSRKCELTRACVRVWTIVS